MSFDDGLVDEAMDLLLRAIDIQEQSNPVVYSELAQSLQRMVEYATHMTSGEDRKQTEIPFLLHFGVHLCTQSALRPCPRFIVPLVTALRKNAGRSIRGLPFLEFTP